MNHPLCNLKLLRLYLNPRWSSLHSTHSLILILTLLYHQASNRRRWSTAADKCSPMTTSSLSLILSFWIHILRKIKHHLIYIRWSFRILFLLLWLPWSWKACLSHRFGIWLQVLHNDVFKLSICLLSRIWWINVPSVRMMWNQILLWIWHNFRSTLIFFIFLIQIHMILILVLILVLMLLKHVHRFTILFKCIGDRHWELVLS